MPTIDYSDPYAVDQAQIEQRMQLAQLLSAQGINQAPSFSNKAAIARMLTGVLGQIDMGKAEQAERALAQRRAADKKGEIDAIFSTLAPSPSHLPTKDDEGNPMPPVQDAAASQRMTLARMLAGSPNQALAAAGLQLAMKGPEAPIVKESDGKIFVLSPDGTKLISQFGGAKVAPPNIADATPESLAKYQQTGNAADLVPRIKMQAVDTGGGTQFVNPENPGGPIPKTMSPGESASDARERARLSFEGINLPPSGAMDHGTQATQIPPGVQAARDDGRMKILLDERARLAQAGQTDPALEREIQLISGQQPQGRAPGLTPKGSAAIAEKTAGGLAEGGVAYKNALDDRVRSGLDLQMRINEARQAVSQFTPGMGAETRLTVARAAQALGMPDSIVNKINAGDVSAKQEFMKLSAQQAMESLKQSMGGAGRIAQAEFKVFQQNNPNIELDPRAIDKIFDFSQRVFQRDAAEQNALTQHLQNGGDISQWPTIWAQQQLKSGIIPDSGGGKTVVRTGTVGGRRVVQYSDGTTAYAN